MSSILAIESTCDETGAAVVVDGRDVRSNVVASQVELHARFRGVVPEIASRAHIENILPVIRQSLDAAACGFADLDAIAVAHRPGLIGSLLVGVTAAKTLAWALNKPLVAVDHVHAHLYSVMLRDKGSGVRAQGSAMEEVGSLRPEPRTLNPLFPAVGLVCSGGHTALYRVNDWTDVALIGSTIDDAVGEAYDKVAAILGLGYPGGPVVDKLAMEGDPKAIRFPRSMLGRESLDFSFSGLKTAVLYHVRGVPGKHQTPPPLNEQSLRDVCASFQAACIDTIVKKLTRAIAQTGAKSVIIGGGVSANRGLRAAMQKFPLPVLFPPMEYCTDNAAMTGGLAHVLLEKGQTATLELDAITYSQFAPS
jgi:tRNA N6-adenosine threonylcarbamoyltransferase